MEGDHLDKPVHGDYPANGGEVISLCPSPHFSFEGVGVPVGCEYNVLIASVKFHNPFYHVLWYAEASERHFFYESFSLIVCSLEIFIECEDALLAHAGNLKGEFLDHDRLCSGPAFEECKLFMRNEAMVVPYLKQFVLLNAKGELAHHLLELEWSLLELVRVAWFLGDTID
jgi:hypothetical protein